MKAVFTKINIWIYIKISTSILVTAKIPSFSKRSIASGVCVCVCVVEVRFEGSTGRGHQN